MVTSKYLLKSEIIGWINLWNEDFEESDIPDEIMNQAHAKVDAELSRKKCWQKADGFPTKSDPYDFLKFACTGFCLDLLCRAGVIGQTRGEILANRFGDVLHSYQRTNPLFFFATGSSERFMDLLPYETLRMFAYSYITAYCRYKYYTRTGYKTPQPVLVIDQTSRGAYWNMSYETHDVADAEYGETLPEEW